MENSMRKGTSSPESKKRTGYLTENKAEVSTAFETGSSNRFGSGYPTSYPHNKQQNSVKVKHKTKSKKKRKWEKLEGVEFHLHPLQSNCISEIEEVDEEEEKEVKKELEKELGLTEQGLTLEQAEEDMWLRLKAEKEEEEREKDFEDYHYCCREWPFCGPPDEFPDKVEPKPIFNIKRALG